MSEEVTPAQFAALVTALRMKGETVDEVVGLASAMRDRAVACARTASAWSSIPAAPGGDQQGHLQCLHRRGDRGGGRGVCGGEARQSSAASSKCGSADVLEALGVHITMTSEQVTAGLERIGIAFMLGAALSSRHALCRGATARNRYSHRVQYSWAADQSRARQRPGAGRGGPELAPMMAGALDRLGTRHALVVSGHEGLDEISISGPTAVWELERGTIRTYQIEPRAVWLSRGAARSGDRQQRGRKCRDATSGV